MSSLRELQQRAYRAIALGDDSQRAQLPGVSEIGIEVYRNNARETFRRTLAVTYPTVERLVGPDCFRSLAHTYDLECPSRCGDLGRYGAELPALLDTYYSGTEFGYLADVARLEWALAEVETAPDAVRLDFARLEVVEPESYPDLRFALHPASRFVSSRYPVLTIWEANQQERVERVEGIARTEHALIVRVRGDASVVRLDAGTFAFAVSLERGESLGDAEEVGRAAAPEFDLAVALTKLDELGMLVGFALPATRFLQ